MIPEGQAEKVLGYNPDAMTLDEFAKWCKDNPVGGPVSLPQPTRICADCGSVSMVDEDGSLNQGWRCLRCGSPETFCEAEEK